MEEKAKGKYTKSEGYDERRQELVKQFKNEINNAYFSALAKTLSEKSAMQYRSAVIRFEEHLEGKDLMTAKVTDINSYLETCKESTRENQKRFVQSFLKHTFTNFSEQATIKADSSTILSMMDDVAKKLMSILMNK